MEEVKNFQVRISKMGHKVLAIFFTLICAPGNYSTVFSFNIVLLRYHFVFFINNNAERRLFVNVNLPVSNCLTQELTFNFFFHFNYFIFFIFIIISDLTCNSA